MNWRESIGPFHFPSDILLIYVIIQSSSIFPDQNDIQWCSSLQEYPKWTAARRVWVKCRRPYQQASFRLTSGFFPQSGGPCRMPSTCIRDPEDLWIPLVPCSPRSSFATAALERLAVTESVILRTHSALPPIFPRSWTHFHRARNAPNFPLRAM